MFILWIRKRPPDDDGEPPKAAESLEIHNEAMKKFRREHPDIPEIIEVVKPHDIVLTDGDVLAAVEKVKVAASSKN